MVIGKTYDAVFSTGSYEIEYEKSVLCIKITPKSYRVRRPDGTTRLIGQDSIMELKEVAGVENAEIFPGFKSSSAAPHWRR
jgi:hypothetical protein